MNDIVQVGSNTAVDQWDPASGAALPAYITEAQGELGSNIADRVSVPSLSYEGKTWQIIKDGNRTKLQVQNGDGDMVPVPIMRVLILGYNPSRGRAYYPGNYNPANSAAPDCWSADGKTPDASVKAKQSPTCDGCPLSIKGSKVQDGKEMVACSSHRMVAVAPAFEMAADPLRLKIAVTSDYDKEIVEHGWYAFRQYADFLKSRGINHTGLVITKIKFDMQAQYPKLLFALDRVLMPDEITVMKAAVANPKVAELLAEKWSAAGSAGTLTNDADIAPQPDLQEVVPASQQVITQQATTALSGLAAAVADGWIAHPNAPGYHYKGADVVADADVAARYPTPAAPVVAAAPSPPPPPPAPEPEAPPVVPKPTDPAHIAHVGTANELWWNGSEWVTPWEPGNASVPAAVATSPATTESAGTAAAGASSEPTSTGASTELSADVQALLGKWAG